jgi:hypothetical protein
MRPVRDIPGTPLGRPGTGATRRNIDDLASQRLVRSVLCTAPMPSLVHDALLTLFRNRLMDDNYFCRAATTTSAGRPPY